MADWFASGRIVDLVLLLVAVEIAALPWLLQRLGSRLSVYQLLPNIIAGIALMLALRASLVDAAWPWISTALLVALAAHLGDLALRLRERSPGQ